MANGRLVPQKIYRGKISGLDVIPLWGSHIEGDPAVPRTGGKLAVGPGDRIAPQDRFVTDDFRKALRIVLNEVQFGKAAYFEL